MIKNLVKLFTTDLNLPKIESIVGEESLLVQKGNQMHVLQIWIVLIYSISFSIINYFLGFYAQSIIMLIGIPGSLMAIVFFTKGHILLSKIWNSLLINFVLSLTCFYTTIATGIVAFFIPLIIGTQIALQGKDRKVGLYISIFSFINMLFLLIADLHYDSGYMLTHAQLEQEILINLTAATIACLIQIIFVLRLNNQIEQNLIYKSIELKEKNAELQKANNELDNFVYSVSHDLRSPVISVKSLLELVLQRKDLDESIAEYLKMGERSLIHLDDTIREILEYSRNTRLGPVIESFDVKRILDQIFTDLKYAAGNDFSFKIEIIGPFQIVADKARFNTVIRNIIGNAVKYRRKDISDSFVLFKMDASGKKVKIEVLDNGEGISASNLEKVFDMFFRGTSTGLGTGLGLYICKEIIEKMNGTISIDSELGKGTKVNIELHQQI